MITAIVGYFRECPLLLLGALVVVVLSAGGHTYNDDEVRDEADDRRRP